MFIIGMRDILNCCEQDAAIVVACGADVTAVTCVVDGWNGIGYLKQASSFAESATSVLIIF